MFRDSNKANQAWTGKEDRRLLKMRAAGRFVVINRKRVETVCQGHCCAYLSAPCRSTG